MIPNIRDLEIVFATFVSSAIGIVALITIAMIIFGGLKYLTSGADKEGASSANRTITFGIIGLIITISAWIILSLMGTFLGIPNLGTFRVTL